MIPVLSGVAVAIGLYLAALAAVTRLGLRPPRIPLYLSASQFDCPQETVAFVTEDGVPLRAWWMGHERPKAIVFVGHGYLMNRCEHVAAAARLWRAGYACLLVDFRVHGDSGGRLCGLGYHERKDVAAAVRWARGRAPGVAVVLYGGSMGAAACAWAAADDACLADALILDSPYSTLPDAMSGIVRVFLGSKAQALFAPGIFLSSWWLRFRPWDLDLTDALRKIERPILLLHGRRDRLIPPARAERNAAAIRNLHGPVWFDSGHVEARMDDPRGYVDTLLAFLAEVLPNRDEPKSQPPARL
ncbi:MAG: alpha/beta hydrolase [Fimbriimonadaceae bacterium]|nr:alpha/beta hydrolase [Fimbriimonadaceae bacterium]